MLEDAESYDVDVANRSALIFAAWSHDNPPFPIWNSQHQHFKNLLTLGFAGIFLSDAYSDMHKLQNKSPRNNAMRFGKRAYKILAALTQSQAVKCAREWGCGFDEGLQKDSTRSIITCRFLATVVHS